MEYSQLSINCRIVSCTQIILSWTYASPIFLLVTYAYTDLTETLGFYQFMILQYFVATPYWCYEWI